MPLSLIHAYTHSHTYTLTGRYIVQFQHETSHYVNNVQTQNADTWFQHKMLRLCSAQTYNSIFHLQWASCVVKLFQDSVFEGYPSGRLCKRVALVWRWVGQMHNSDRGDEAMAVEFKTFIIMPYHLTKQFNFNDVLPVPVTQIMH